MARTQPRTARPASREALQRIRSGRRRRGLLLLLLLLPLAVVIIHRTRPEPPSEAIAFAASRAVRGPVRIALSERGVVRAVRLTTLRAPGQAVLAWLAPEGLQVRAGERVAAFDVHETELERDRARGEAALARSELGRAERQLEAQRIVEQREALAFQSLPELAARGLIDPSELERARLAFELVRARTRAEEAAVEVARLRTSRAAAAEARIGARLAAGVLKAPRDGRVARAVSFEAGSARPVGIGMQTYEGMELLHLTDPLQVRVEIEIDERDLASVRVGQPVEVLLPVLPGAVLRGELAALSMTPRRLATGGVVFDAAVRLLDEDVQLRPGLSAIAEIVLTQSEDALQVPVAAIFFDARGAPFVYRRLGAGIERVRVDLGGSTAQVVVVERGLAEGDEVLLEPPAPGGAS